MTNKTARNVVEVIKGKELQVSDAVYAYQFDGKGGVNEINAQCVASDDKPCWLHLDYTLPASEQWINTTPLLFDTVREALAGESVHAKAFRMGVGTLITPPTPNLTAASSTYQPLPIRVYVTVNRIAATLHHTV